MVPVCNIQERREGGVTKKPSSQIKGIGKKKRDYFAKRFVSVVGMGLGGWVCCYCRPLN